MSPLACPAEKFSREFSCLMVGVGWSKLLWMVPYWMDIEHFMNYWLMWEGSANFGCYPWAGGSRF